MSCAGSPPHVDLDIDRNELFDGAQKLLTHIRPSWQPDDISFKLFTDGITNKLVHASLRSAPNEVVLIRIYGDNTDLLINREAEIRNIQLLEKAGFAPQLYATFNNGLAYEFAPGRTLNSETVRSGLIFPLVARKMAKLHRVALPAHLTPARPVLWDLLHKYLSLLPEQLRDEHNWERFKKEFHSVQSLKLEVDLLQKELSNIGSPVVMCHNDLLLNNVIFDADNNKVAFIDYEYTAPNYQAFDIGNHFAEFAGVATVDYAYYPDKTFQLKWLRVYLEELGKDNSAQITEKQVEELYIQVNKFALCSHLCWGIWALLQSEISEIDFDYYKYGEIRLKEYFAKKIEFLSL